LLGEGVEEAVVLAAEVQEVVDDLFPVARHVSSCCRYRL
jgi:hypothetical protein